MWFFVWFAIILQVFLSSENLMTILSDIFARAFDTFGATLFVTLDIPKVFERVWHAGLLHKFKSYISLCEVFVLILSFFNNGFEWLWMGNLCRNIHFMVPIRPTLFLPYISPNLSSVSVVFLSMLIILSTRSLLRHLIWGNN